MDVTGTKPIKILVTGPLRPPVGGTTVLFETLVAALLQRSDVELRLLPLPSVRRNLMRAAAPLLRHIVGLLRYTSESDVVSLHCNPRGLHAHVAVVSAITRLFGKPLVVRAFGGESLHEHARLVGSDRFIRTLRKADLYLVETRWQVQEARDEGARVEWFPNHRQMPPEEHKRIEADGPCRRFDSFM
ncbi:MAG TPA: hypothetical protein VIL33_03065, partial [Rhodothermia bacterium]